MKDLRNLEQLKIKLFNSVTTEEVNTYVDQFLKEEQDIELRNFVSLLRSFSSRKIRRMLEEFIDASEIRTIGSIVDSGNYFMFELGNETYTFSGLSDIDGEPRFLKLGTTTHVKLNRDEKVVRLF